MHSLGSRVSLGLGKILVRILVNISLRYQYQYHVVSGNGKSLSVGVSAGNVDPQIKMYSTFNDSRNQNQNYGDKVRTKDEGTGETAILDGML